MKLKKKKINSTYSYMFTKSSHYLLARTKRIKPHHDPMFPNFMIFYGTTSKAHVINVQKQSKMTIIVTLGNHPPCRMCPRLRKYGVYYCFIIFFPVHKIVRTTYFFCNTLTLLHYHIKILH